MKNTKFRCLKRPPYCTNVQLVDNMEFVLVVVDREILALRVINRPLVALVVLIFSAQLYISKKVGKKSMKGSFEQQVERGVAGGLVMLSRQ